jgi:uncharacterized protein YndB with AHSA1/START domain
MTATSKPRQDADRELLITRTFDAPRKLLFEAWTRPEHLARWSGPHGFTTTQDKMDLRPGGAYRACLHAPDGRDHWVRGVYREIVEPERLVFTHAWEDEDGQPGLETVVTVTFEERGNQTEMRFHQAFFETTASRDGHQSGWSESFQRLAEHLAAIRGADALRDAVR